MWAWYVGVVAALVLGAYFRQPQDGEEAYGVQLLVADAFVGVGIVLVVVSVVVYYRKRANYRAQ
jgi:hypothetical protein